MKLLREISLSDEVENILYDENFILNDEDMLFEIKKEVYQPKKKSLNHLDHLEDLVIRHGEDGMSKAADYILSTHQYLQGKKNDRFNITSKFDGSPSLIWGHHPEAKKFFVGTKSVFNKSPKVNFTNKDIDNNHGKSPGLVRKLKNALTHLKNVTPKKGVYQGDLMYTSDDVGEDGKHYSISPNTISYKIPKESVEGKKIGASKIGIAPHTTYEDGSNALYKFDQSQFKDDPDVHFFDPKLKGSFNYSPKVQQKVINHLTHARHAYNRVSKTGGLDALKDHQKLLLAYINHSVKSKKENTTSGYISFLRSEFEKKVDDLKTDKGKESLKKNLNHEISNVMENQESFDSMFEAHKHIQGAKNAMIDVLSSKSPYSETILGNKSKPEGFVANIDNEPVKLVDRNHFSAANFEWNEKVNPDHNPTVLVWGRMNPPTAGHQKLVDVGSKIADKSGAKLKVVASASHDSKNPLTPADKLKWLKSMFPKADVTVAGPDRTTMIAQLHHLHSTGVKHLTIVAGSDRVPEYEKLIAKYNGPEPGKMFHFPKVRIISGGQRDPESKDIGGISSTKMKRAVSKDDFLGFKKTVPAHLDDNKVKRMFISLKTAMKQTQKK